MKKLLLVALGFLPFTFTSTAQEGIQFQSAAGWQEVLARAKQENKYIFVDCYATWCGPCKMMDKTVFPDKEVGQFINDKFIAVKVQMDKTKDDAASTKKWYSDAQKLESEYSVDAFPTYLFFSPNGEVLHRFVGGTKTGAEFIGKVKLALDPAMQYYPNVIQYKEHLKDSAYLRNAIRMALREKDWKMASDIGNAYLGIVDPFVKENLGVLRSVTMTTKDKGYDIVVKNAEKVNNIMGERFAYIISSTVMYQTDLREYFETEKTLESWNKHASMLKKKYHLLKPIDIDKYAMGYYRTKNNTPEFEKAMIFFMDTYYSELNDVPFNENAWAIFTLSDNRKMLETALKWSERGIELVPKTPGSNYPNYMDTYANLLHKLGRKEEAIAWQKKAIAAAELKSAEKLIAAMKKTLEKMEKGERTW
jgi:thioredoxin-related protein